MYGMICTRHVVGSLMYGIICTRLDIADALSVVRRFMKLVKVVT